MSLPPFTVVGVQDGSFKAFQRGLDNSVQYTSLCITCLQSRKILDIRLTQIKVDGSDATDKLLNSLEKIETDAIILGGVTFAGFNVVYTGRVYRETGIPVIVFSTDFPDMQATKAALCKHFSDWEKRWVAYEELGQIYSLRIGDYSPVFFEVVGCTRSFAEEILRDQIIVGKVPEALRVADKIAKGVSPFFSNLRG